MTDVIPVQGALLDSVLDATYPIWHDGLDRHTYGKVYAAQIKTAWGRRYQRFALAEGVLASVDQYDLGGRFDGRAVRICGIGSVFIDPAHRGLSQTGLEDDARNGFAGIRALPVHAISEDAKRFYERCGLTTSPLDPLTLMITVADAEKALSGK